MYIPKHFKETDEQEIERFIHENSFGIIVSIQDGLPIGTHIPFMIEKREGELILRAHISRANEQKESLIDGTEVLIISTVRTHISHPPGTKETKFRRGISSLFTPMELCA